jgi:hypothetical protein
VFESLPAGLPSFVRLQPSPRLRLASQLRFVGLRRAALGLPKVVIGKGSAGSGFQVTLKSGGTLIVIEANCGCDMLGGIF